MFLRRTISLFCFVSLNLNVNLGFLLCFYGKESRLSHNIFFQRKDKKMYSQLTLRRESGQDGVCIKALPY